MIIDQIERLDCYSGISQNMGRAIDFLQKTDLSVLPAGAFAVDGARVTCTVVDHVLKEMPNFWEAHRKYIDIHAVVRGSEIVRCQLERGTLDCVAYDSQTDVSVIAGYAGGYGVTLHAGEALVLFPGELHQPNCPCSADGHVKKLVIKVLCDGD